MHFRSVCKNAVASTVKSAITWIADKISHPFRYDLSYFIVLFAINACLCCGLIVLKGALSFAIVMALFYYLSTYILVFITNIIQRAEKILKPLFLLISVVLLALNLFCIYRYKTRLPIIVIAGTNLGEMREYIEAYFSWSTVVLCSLATLGLTVLLYGITQRIKIRMTNPKAISIFLGLLVVSCISSICNPKIIPYLFKITDTADIEKYDYQPTCPKIESENRRPSYVITIFGESFCPSHSSLYGYDKPTNPLLDSVRKAGNLIVFNRVLSPDTRTADVFKSVLNTYLTDTAMTRTWSQCTNLIEVLNIVGYHTTWLSNQDETGLISNIPGGHAKICHDSSFIRARYDGALADCEVAENEFNAVFYHLWGQHYLFDERYPEEYDIFQPSDYQSLTGGGFQAEILAQYDNATLYNDRVVSAIIDKYSAYDTILFYFSDHALDLFDTDPNFYGHAKNTPESQAVAKKIPFMVYLSPLCQQLRPEMTARIRDAADKEFCTDRFIYAVMDAVGLRFADNDDVYRYSLFTPSAAEEEM